jgi:hypothetical protein
MNRFLSTNHRNNLSDMRHFCASVVDLTGFARE